jgi:hypothetical protein
VHRPSETAPVQVARQAAHAIYQRRRAGGDPDLDRFDAIDVEDPWQVDAFVASHQRVSGDALAEDALDCLRVLDYLLGELERRRLARIRLARRNGATWQRIAGALGLRSRAGAEALFVRLAHAAADRLNVKDERQARRTRRKPTRATATALTTAALRKASDRDRQLRALVGRLVDCRDLPADAGDDLRYMLGELARGRAAGAGLPESVYAQLRLSVAEIRCVRADGSARELAEQIAQLLHA